MEVREKLVVLADAAKYDASCASSGSKSTRSGSKIGTTEGMGICHSYTPDGRCISLLKILLTNYCIYDCQYCVNRISSDTPRVRFTVDEVVSLTMSFYLALKFLELARTVACHRDAQRWAVLYRTLWRIKHGEPHLLAMETDDDVHQLGQMRKAVSRDVHKMKAFVRFRKVDAEDDSEAYVAWHRPDHRIVRLAAPFFARRFQAMNWTIFTPHESACWNQSQLTYGDGVGASEAPDQDALEDLWKAYYASIFNPARVKVATMKREMPVRHWPTLPETELIPELLRQAPSRVEAMIETHEGFADTAIHFLPEDRSLASLAAAADCCRACDLHVHATATQETRLEGDLCMSALVGSGTDDHPAGHMLGSAQVRLEHRGQVAVVTADYKLEIDPTCQTWQPVKCDLMVTESTFGLPVYHWAQQRLPGIARGRRVYGDLSYSVGEQ